ncbi:MAG: hypothetical protein KC561_07770 [Myxococcales bacterium]|nr:hypothetical protein [Myxococcales bacterium]
MNNTSLRLIAAFLMLTLGACLNGTSPSPSSNSPEEVQDDRVEDLFSGEVTEIVIEVDYQPGAEPYTGDVRGQDVWNLFRVNAEALFSESEKTFVVPSTLDEMEELTDINGEDFTIDDIMSIAAAHDDSADTDTTRTFYFLFLDGYYFQDGERQSSVLGVSITGTSVIAMFKPVIESTSLPALQFVAKYVEQSTLVHEFGHAVGLVNNGLDMVQNHNDGEHGAHCDNDQCVMYWLNEGASDMASFVQQIVTTGDAVIFDENCLNDAAAGLH